jgi:oligoribonuclease NrnB/cAMP/cGMP phosphodiesterase (DHH superfamily)
MNKTAIIAHERNTVPCPDGIAAAAIASLYCIEQSVPFVYLGAEYRNDRDYPEAPDIELPEGTNRLLIVDFSFPLSWLNFWKACGLDVVVIEHHEKKFGKLSQFSGAVLDADECGATLAWKTFFPGRQQPCILKYIRQRDIGADGYYKADNNGEYAPAVMDSRHINQGLSELRFQAGKIGIDYLLGFYTGVLNYDIAQIDQLREAGIERYAQNMARIQALSATAEIVELDNYPVAKVKLEKDDDYLYSELGTQMCRAHADVKFAWIITSDGVNHLRSLSGRSGSPDPGFDVSMIAAKHGGDGHWNAAAWTDAAA